MKATSDKSPLGGCAIQKVGTLADIRFFENIAEIVENEETRYEYDVYTLVMEWSEGLQNEMMENPEPYLSAAKDAESKKYVVLPTTEEMALSLLETQEQLQDAQDALDFLIMGGV